MKEEIQKIFKGEVDNSEETLKKNSHDASLFDVRHQFVLFPKETENVKKITKWVGENKQK